MKRFSQSESRSHLRQVNFDLVQVGDHLTPAVGLTFTGAEIQVRQYPLGWVNATGASYSNAGGSYGYTFTQAELSGVGRLQLKIADAAADIKVLEYLVVDPGVFYGDLYNGVIYADVDGVAGAAPGVNGLYDRPISNYTDLFTLADAMNIRNIRVMSVATMFIVDDDIEGLHFEGVGSLFCMMQLGTTLSPISIINSSFAKIGVAGDSSFGTIETLFKECGFANDGGGDVVVVGLLNVENCVLFGGLVFDDPSGKIFGILGSDLSGADYSNLGLDPVVIDFGGWGPGLFVLENFSGSVLFSGISDAVVDGRVGCIAGARVSFDDTCTLGKCEVRGFGHIIFDESADAFTLNAVQLFHHPNPLVLKYNVVEITKGDASTVRIHAEVGDQSFVGMRIRVEQGGVTQERTVQSENIPDATHSWRDLTFDFDLTFVPVNGDTVAIDLGIPVLDAQNVATQALITALNDPTSASIADAIWTEVLSPHADVSGSAARAFSVIKGLLLGNYTLDGGLGEVEVQRNGNGFPIVSRLRVWDSSVNTPAVGGGSETPGLLGTVMMTGAPHTEFINLSGFVRALLTET